MISRALPAPSRALHALPRPPTTSHDLPRPPTTSHGLLPTSRAPRVQVCLPWCSEYLCDFYPLYCAGCAICNAAAAPAAPPPRPSVHATGAHCHAWCASYSWADACVWNGCDGCAACATTDVCAPWCDDSPWDESCSWNKCRGCAQCGAVPAAAQQPATQRAGGRQFPLGPA